MLLVHRAWNCSNALAHVQVVPTLSVPRIRAILRRFQADDFAPDPLPHGAPPAAVPVAYEGVPSEAAMAICCPPATTYLCWSSTT